MISIAMKNGILFLLIILITHFLIKNYLMDHAITHGIVKEPFVIIEPPQTMVQQEVEDKLIETKNNEEEDLFKYVFNTDDLTSKEVDNSEYTFIEPSSAVNKKQIPELKTDLGFKDVIPFDTFSNFSTL